MQFWFPIIVIALLVGGAVHLMFLGGTLARSRDDLPPLKASTPVVPALLAYLAVGVVVTAVTYMTLYSLAWRAPWFGIGDAVEPVFRCDDIGFAFAITIYGAGYLVLSLLGFLWARIDWPLLVWLGHGYRGLSLRSLLLTSLLGIAFNWLILSGTCRVV